MQIPLSVKLGVYALIALISAGFAFVYYDEVTTARVMQTKLIYDARADAALEPDTQLADRRVVDRLFTSVTLPAPVATSQLSWALPDTEAVRAGLVGLVVATKVQPGDFLRPEDFVKQSDDNLARKVTNGLRAFSIPVRPGNAVGTFLTPAARVDVMHTIIQEDETANTEVLLSNVVLMAVGEYQSPSAFVEAGRPTYTSLTVQASQDQITSFLERTEASRGQVTVVLRNPCDGNPDCQLQTVAGSQPDE